MGPLTPEEMEAEIISFNMLLNNAHEKGEIYITIHKDVAQRMIDSHTDISGCNLAQEEKISDLELELEVLLEQFKTLKGNAMNDTENNEETAPPAPVPNNPELTDAIRLSLSELRSVIEVGKSIARLEVLVNIDAAEYLVSAYEVALEQHNSDTDFFAEVDESDGDFSAEIGDLNDRVSSLEHECAGHMERVAKRDGTILELQEAIVDNNGVNTKRVEALIKTIDELHDQLAEAKETLNDGADVAGDQPEENDEEE